LTCRTGRICRTLTHVRSNAICLSDSSTRLRSGTGNPSAR